MHEDDAERAVGAALAVIEAVRRLPAREDLRLRLGIATGLAVVGDLIGEGAAQERGVVGETLVTVGAHTPEFGFEKDIANVRQATNFYDVRYPVATDNDFAIWNSFSNAAWPAFYLIGADGRVRLRMLGEGDYDKIELAIQKLLAEANSSTAAADVVAVAGEGPEAAADERDLRTPETYVGYAKATNFSSPCGVARDAAKPYQTPSSDAGLESIPGLFNIRSRPIGDSVRDHLTIDERGASQSRKKSPASRLHTPIIRS